MVVMLLKTWKQLGLLLVLCLLFYGAFLLPRSGSAAHIRLFKAPSPPLSDLFGDLHLNGETCEAVFPGLTKDIDDIASLGPFPLKQARNQGPLQIRIHGSQIHIVHKEDDDILTPGTIESRTAALHQIHRAIVTSPEPLPDVTLSVNVQDGPADFTLSYSRPAYDSQYPGTQFISRAFLMPHFSFWAWPLPFVGSFGQAAEAINSIETSLPFSKKDPRVVWRGSKRYKSAHHPHLREDLLRTTAESAWADVQTLKWQDVSDGNKTERIATNSLRIEEFCRYKYVLYTDGITYSGRLQFHQMCGSVLLTPPIAWMQHTSHFIKPLFSSDLDFQPTSTEGKGGKWAPSEGETRAWPTHYSPEEANLVFVAPDWSDLEDTVQWLEDHPDVAEGIAKRQRELFVGGGYFSPAAEVCYWRALIRSWSNVAQTAGEGWEDQPGVRWELFSMGL